MTKEGPADFVFVPEHIATFDNDGTPWAEPWAYDRHSQVGQLDRVLDAAQANGWTVVDMKVDWKMIYPPRRK